MSQFPMRKSEGVWLNDQGKSIPYTKESYDITNDELSNYSIEVTKWSKNTTISISIVTSDKGIDDDWETRSLTESIHRLAKMPHSEFDSQKAELIARALELIKDWTEN